MPGAANVIIEARAALLAGRAEEGVGQPDVVTAAVSFLAQDLLRAVKVNDN